MVRYLASWAHTLTHTNQASHFLQFRGFQRKVEVQISEEVIF